ncbi:short-chain dehydrogenase/reductase [Aspergillus bertholletiae]|uniref:Short-chain dehydrogenase/reductase n=1 Tax=Aspergillus bertholletiae TaxID=1226010 RepID=A0A5N7BI59_9EURO|nr:short-chain dehydrogenase/reductase [Aspergillus bertholletiae]
MASIAAVRDNNSRITQLYGSGLVAVFVGGTSGIGESTARAFVRNTAASRVYLIGRDQARASQIIKELQQVNPDTSVDFIKSDVSLLRGVDEACHTIQQKEERLNLLFLSPGVATTKGRDETDEGLDKKLSLHYYARMRFVANLLPQLTKAEDHAGTSAKPGTTLSRVVSVLEAGGESVLDLQDLSLKTHYSLRNCAKHAITMNSLSMEHLASSYPQVSFIHSFPGIVKTSLGRDSHPITKLALNALMVLAKPWEVPFEESGERHLYAATSPRFPPQSCKDNGNDTAEGSDGHTGSGFYRLGSDGSTYKPSKVMEEYRRDGVRDNIWKHTLDIFANVRGG